MSCLLAAFQSVTWLPFTHRIGSSGSVLRPLLQHRHSIMLSCTSRQAASQLCARRVALQSRCLVPRPVVSSRRNCIARVCGVCDPIAATEHCQLTQRPCIIVVRFMKPAAPVTDARYNYCLCWKCVVHAASPKLRVPRYIDCCTK